jgi:hypothetical protein
MDQKSGKRTRQEQSSHLDNSLNTYSKSGQIGKVVVVFAGGIVGVGNKFIIRIIRACAIASHEAAPVDLFQLFAAEFQQIDFFVHKVLLLFF